MYVYMYVYMYVCRRVGGAAAAGGGKVGGGGGGGGDMKALSKSIRKGFKRWLRREKDLEVSR